MPVIQSSEKSSQSECPESDIAAVDANAQSKRRKRRAGTEPTSPDVRWPDPSPLADWWRNVMGRKT
jgi:hypothetical protein